MFTQSASVYPRRATVLVACALAIVVAAPTASADPVAANNKARVGFDELLRLSLSGPKAKLAHYRAEMARAQADEAKAARVGTLSLTAFIGPSPDIECANADCTRTSPEDPTVSLAGVFGGVRVTAVQPVYTFGKLSAVSKAARSAQRAATHWKNAVAGNIAVDVARAYYGLKLARELRYMLEDGQAEIDKALATIKKKLASGASDVTVQDRLRVQVLKAEVVARLIEATAAEAVALAGVRALSSKPKLDVDATPLEAASYQLASSVTGYVSKAQAGRPEVRAARAAAAGARHYRKFESAKLWPDLVAVGSVNVARAQGVEDPPSAFANDPFNTTTAVVGLALRWKLDPLRQRARIRRARAQAGRADTLVQAATLTARFEVRKAHAEASGAQKRVAAARTGYKSAKGWVASVMQAEAVGTLQAKDFADAYIAFFTLRARYLTSVYEWNLAVVALRRALGEVSAAGERP